MAALQIRDEVRIDERTMRRVRQLESMSRASGASNNRHGSDTKNKLRSATLNRPARKPSQFQNSKQMVQEMDKTG